MCIKYLERMDKINCVLEMELGITGGEEDGVNNEDVAMEKLYSQPEEVDRVYTALSKVSKNFTIAASFGNVHGVYKPGNVKLSPAFLGKHQAFIKEKHSTEDDLPALLVFHGGSGSTKAEILEAIGHGVIKMNIDTDTRTFGLCRGRYLTVGSGCEAFLAWGEREVASGSVRARMLPCGAVRILGTYSAGSSASDLFGFLLACCLLLVSDFLVGCLRLCSSCLHLICLSFDLRLTEWAYWAGIKDFYKSKEAYLQAQIGNPDGEDKPNKKYYDPRVWMRKAEQSFVKRLAEAFEDLNCSNVN